MGALLRQFQGISDPHPNKGEKYRGVSWKLVEVIDRKENCIGKFDSSERHTLTNAQRRAEKYFIKYERALAGQDFGGISGHDRRTKITRPPLVLRLKIGGKAVCPPNLPGFLSGYGRTLKKFPIVKSRRLFEERWRAERRAVEGKRVAVVLASKKSAQVGTFKARRIPVSFDPPPPLSYFYN